MPKSIEYIDMEGIMKQEFVTYKNENKMIPARVFEIIILAFLVFAFSAFLILINVEKIEPTIENSDEIASVFKQSAFCEFLGFEEAKKEETITEKEQIVEEYISKNGEINVFEYFFDMGW